MLISKEYDRDGAIKKDKFITPPALNSAGGVIM